MLPAMELNGVGAIVSGGASGLGEATVRELAAAGCQVVVADLNDAQGKAVADDVGGVFVRTDVADEQSVQAAVDAAASAGRAAAGRRELRGNRLGRPHRGPRRDPA